MKSLIFLGAPGAGKGTQSKKVAESNNLMHISTGDILRKEVKANSELGRKAKDYMDNGNLVPDSLILAMLADALKAIGEFSGFILDGFPRNINQAEKLDEMLLSKNISITNVIYLAVQESFLVERLSGRRICSSCGKEYHVLFNKPEKENICDIDGEDLYRRSDDHSVEIKNRLSTYHESTNPLISFYTNKKLLDEVDASQDINDVTIELNKKIS